MLSRSIFGFAVVVAMAGAPLLAAEPATRELPGYILRAADSLVAARIGPALFTDSISFRPDASRFVPPEDACALPRSACSDERTSGYYEIRYSFRIADKPFVDEIVGVALTPDGRPVAGDPFFGVPECADRPAACEFTVDAAAAIRIANRAGLAPGVRSVKAEFQWYAGALRRYVWTVSNTLENAPGHQAGESFVIDAAGGGVLLKNQWTGNE